MILVGFSRLIQVHLWLVANLNQVIVSQTLECHVSEIQMLF